MTTKASQRARDVSCFLLPRFPEPALKGWGGAVATYKEVKATSLPTLAYS